MRKNASMTNSSSLILVRSHPDKPAGEVCDLQTLKAWVRDGTVKRDQLIFDPQNQKWVPAYQFGPISAIFTQQLWDAWEEADITAVRAVSVETEPAEETRSITPEGPPENVESNESVEIEIDLDDALFAGATTKSITSETPKPSQAEPEVIEDDPIADVLAMFDAPTEQIESEEENVFDTLVEELSGSSKPKLSRLQEPSMKSIASSSIEELPLSALGPLEDKKTKTPPPKREQQSRRSSTTAKENTSRHQSRPKASPPRPASFSMEHAKPFRLPLTGGMPTRRPPQSNSGIRWGRIFMIIAPFAMLFLIFNWYVGSTATAQFPKGEDLDRKVSKNGIGANTIAQGLDDPYSDLDIELRSKLRPACLTISPETMVEDIMTVELDALGVDVIGIRASIVEWTGRKQDRPRTATFRFRLKGGESFEYELAAVALVVGKYMENYVMDVAKLDVTIDTRQKSLQFALEPELAGRYYRSNIGLSELFSMSK